MQLNVRSIALVLAVTLGAGYALVPVFANAPSQVLLAADDHDDHHEESPLGEAMGHMADAKGALQDALDVGDAAAALAALTDFQTHVIAAKAEAPPRAAKMDAAKRKTFVAAFRAALIDVLRVSCDVELALMEGRVDAAKAIVDGKLGEMEGAGHENFGGED